MARLQDRLEAALARQQQLAGESSLQQGQLEQLRRELKAGHERLASLEGQLAQVATQNELLKEELVVSSGEARSAVKEGRGREERLVAELDLLRKRCEGLSQERHARNADEENRQARLAKKEQELGKREAELKRREDNNKKAAAIYS